MRTLLVIAALVLGIPAAKAAPTNCSTVCHNIGGGYQQCTTTCS